MAPITVATNRRFFVLCVAARCTFEPVRNCDLPSFLTSFSRTGKAEKAPSCAEANHVFSPQQPCHEMQWQPGPPRCPDQAESADGAVPA